MNKKKVENTFKEMKFLYSDNQNIKYIFSIT